MNPRKRDDKIMVVGDEGDQCFAPAQSLQQAMLRDREACYRTLMETASEGIWWTDLDETIVAINSSAVKMLGYPESELVGESLRTLIFKDDLPLIKAKRANRADVNERFELRLLRRDGTLIWVQASLRNLLDRQGQQIGTLGMVSDITEYKQIREQLRQSESRFRRLFESDAMGILLADADGRITDANNALSRMLGLTRDDIEHGLYWKDLIAPECHTVADVW